MKLDDVFEKKDEIANAVKGEPNDAMITYGYDIIKALVTDIDPAGKIRLFRQAVLEGWTAEEARQKDRAGKSRGSGGSRRGDRYRGGKSGNRR